MVYWIHRITHMNEFLNSFHKRHHENVTSEIVGQSWDWKQIFIWIDDLESTIDQWLMEVIPTIIFCWVFNQWWLLVFYWIWAAFVQERVEHNSKLNLYPFITSGRWHLVHHKEHEKNFGVFFPIWDIVFGTNEKNADT